MKGLWGGKKLGQGKDKPSRSCQDSSEWGSWVECLGLCGEGEMPCKTLCFVHRANIMYKIQCDPPHHLSFLPPPKSTQTEGERERTRFDVGCFEINTRERK